MKYKIDVDTAYEKLLQAYPDDISALQKDFVKADLQLQVQYPGQWVAFLDIIDGEENDQRLTRRVLFAKSSMEELLKALADHPQADQLQVDYVEDPNEELPPLLPETAD